MNKFYTLLLLSGAVLSMNAQQVKGSESADVKDAVYQIPNSDFENWASDKALTDGWHSFESATGMFASLAFLSPTPAMIEDGFEGNTFGVQRSWSCYCQWQSYYRYNKYGFYHTYRQEQL